MGKKDVLLSTDHLRGQRLKRCSCILLPPSSPVLWLHWLLRGLQWGLIGRNW